MDRLKRHFADMAVLEKLLPIPHGYKLVEIINNTCRLAKLEDFDQIVDKLNLVF